MRLRRRARQQVFRITAARRGLAEDVRARQRRYVVSMLVRTVAVLLTVLLWNVSLPLAAATLVVGAVLPYVAVVVANAGRENAPSLPSALQVFASSRPALGRGEPASPGSGRSAGAHAADPSFDRR